MATNTTPPTPTNDNKFEIHPSFSSIIDKYDAFILDQFGVLHNGSQSLEGAVECTLELHKRGKKLIILSNTSSSSDVALSKLPKFGFDKSVFLNAITSGEEASRYITETYGNGTSSSSSDSVSNKKKALWFTWQINDDKSSTSSSSSSPAAQFLSKCQVEVTNSIEDATLVIVHGSQILHGGGESSSISLGTFFDDGSLLQIDPILDQCQKKNLPMVCANPDFVMVRPDGTKGHMPGKIAQRYEEMGGNCQSFGKPHKSHFHACLRELNLHPDRVAHVGDSLHHDIAGANASGIDSIFVMGGIHREDIYDAKGDSMMPPSYERLNALFEKEGQIIPTHVVPMFQL